MRGRGGGGVQVQHPAAKLIVYASQAQEQEIGDGSNFVSRHRPMDRRTWHLLAALRYRISVDSVSWLRRTVPNTVGVTQMQDQEELLEKLCCGVYQC